jgi:hypothetical protein
LKAKTYGVTKDNKQDDDVTIELTHKEENNESIPKQETANKKTGTDSVEFIDDPPEERIERIACCQRNLNTFYNSVSRREELANTPVQRPSQFGCPPHTSVFLTCELGSFLNHNLENPSISSLDLFYYLFFTLFSCAISVLLF